MTTPSSAPEEGRTSAPDASASTPGQAPAFPPTQAERSAQAATANNASLWKAATILLTLALVVLLVVFYLRSAGAPEGADSAAQSTPPAAQETQAAPELPEFAPSNPNPEALKILRAEPRRDANDGRAVGSHEAPVVMVEFSDYSCPMCTRFATQVEPELQKFIDDGTLRIEYRDLVIFSQHGSDIAAAGGWAAAAQGKHAEYRHAVWAAAGGGHPEYTEDVVVELAKTAGVPDLEKFRADMTSEDTKAKVKAETEHAFSLGIQGTPFMMINDATISGAYPADFVIRTIEEQAKEAAARK
ncbi:thioredoxin domain-containing protein [Schaalia sp. Marseille-Q2122]|uniref:DsbA family protein n=1 Tax=Schaalia sp. Marseille-Q2122 TaxID=2736604 RepID=UPI00158982B6|nr:thioredoxin domain-containing protein [Schaalia sp. Marseille-Q2122]